MTHALLTCSGGSVALPDPRLVLVDREDGGNLIVFPPRPVWERNELTRDELVAWSFLVASAAQAMLETLPQLEDGCINYWEAGNWALNDEAPPPGRKKPRDHRRVHLHLLGRSPRAKHAVVKWGESPLFPRYGERFEWSAGFRRLTPEECHAIVRKTEESLTSRFGMAASELQPWSDCERCGYPRAAGSAEC